MDTLTPAEAAQILGTSPNRVRQLLRDGKIMAVPGSGNSKIPADFIQDGAVLKHLPGLLTVLRDGGGAARRPAHRGHPPRPGPGPVAGPRWGT